MAPDSTSKSNTKTKEKAQEKGDSSSNNGGRRTGTQLRDPSYYLLLYKAALNANWEEAKEFFEKNPESVTASVAKYTETVLHVASGTGKGEHFVKNLVEKLDPDDLTLVDHNGDSALNIAAVAGDVKVAKILVGKNTAPLYMTSDKGSFPIHKAAQNAHKEMVKYLMTVTKDDVEHNPYSGKSGVLLLVNVIDAGFLDIALELVRQYPHMAQSKLNDGRSALLQISRKPSAFRSSCSLNFWQRFIYEGVTEVTSKNKLKNFAEVDIENPVQDSQINTYNPLPQFARNIFMFVYRNSRALFWKLIKFSLPCVKNIEEMKQMHEQAVELLKCLCEKLALTNKAETFSSIYISPVLQAARSNIPEVVQEVVTTFPTSVWCHNGDKQALFQVAVLHRSEKVFNLIYQMSEHRRFITQRLDKDDCNMLHLAGRLALSHKLNLVPGAALQMQRELQWFKEVEKWMNPQYRVKENYEKLGENKIRKETPAMVFTREHEDLARKGEEWMKKTAESCTIAAALIATVVFAAAITVPGGNDQNSGMPIFSQFDVAFLVFGISDAVSLFTSITSVLMFLSILTARYAEQDFLFSLPRRLIIGLVALFVSITTMIIAFSSTIYLVFGMRKAWTIIPVGALACIPIALFVSLQFPLLRDVVRSTFGTGIFGKQSNRPFY